MSIRISRRQSIQAGLAASAGFWLAPTTPVHSQSPNEKLNIGIIGAGGKGKANIKGVAGHNIVAICDVDFERAKESLNQLPKAERFRDFRKMLDARNDLDAVVVSTPDHTHAAATIMAMRLGKHVYCEKPLTHSLFEARTISRVAAETKVATQMGNQHHSGDNYRSVVKLVQSGAIGVVREAHGWSDRPIWPQGVSRPPMSAPIPETMKWDLWLGPAPQRAYHPAYAPFAWRGWWDFGTGALGDMGCHILDPIYWALNLDAPTKVRAEAEGQSAESGPKKSVVHYKFAARGERPAVRVTWHDGGNLPPKKLVGNRKLPRGGALFVGDQGMLLAAHGKGGFQLLPEEKFRDHPLPPKTATPKMHYTEWLDACRTGSPTGSHFGYAGPLTETVLLGNLAIRLGEPITWDAAQLKVVGNANADALIQREYRAGWSLE